MGKNAKGGVTIVTPTIRLQYIDRIFQNYNRQRWEDKELIVIVNKNTIPLSRYQQQALNYPNVRIFRVTQDNNLGACLNYAAARANHPYIVKFDDDDYYAPNYIPEAMSMFLNSSADVVGKRSCFFYFPHRSTLLLRRTKLKPYRRCRKIAGATIMFHKRVFRKVKFSTKVKQGSDVRFIAACLRKGFQLFSTSPYNFVAYRRADRYTHTWKISDSQLLRSKNALIIRTTTFKTYTDRPLRRLNRIDPQNMHNSPDGDDEYLYGV